MERRRRRRGALVILAEIEEYQGQIDSLVHANCEVRRCFFIA